MPDFLPGMDSLSSMFGKNSVAEQLFIWGVLNQIITSLGTPFFNILEQAALLDWGDQPLSPAELAEAVVRGFLTQGSASGEVGKYGIDSERFATMVHLAGDAPGPAALAEALRRSLIPEQGNGPESISFDQGIREGRLADKWTATIKALAVIPPSQAEALDAYLKGQVTRDEGLARFTEAGGDPTWFETAFTTSGSSPSAVELGVMANRGAIPWTGTGPLVVSFEQGIREGQWRDKWTDAWRALSVYLPPPRTITAMLKEGAISPAEGAHLLKMHGLSDALTTAYVNAASHTTSAAVKQFTLAQVESLYTDKLITEAEAITSVEALKYTPADAKLIVALWDLKAAQSATNSAVARVKALYLNHSIGKTDAQTALTGLQIGANEATGLVAIWDRELAQEVKRLTAAEIASAFGYGIMNQDAASIELQILGYTAFDAWVILSVKNKSPLPGKPTPQPTPPGVPI